MKKILFIALAALLFSSCEAFLDTESYTKKNTGNYPKTADDAIQMVTGVYATLNRVLANTVSGQTGIPESVAPIWPLQTWIRWKTRNCVTS